MADISKCHGSGCLLRRTCKRFFAPASDIGQSWIIEQYSPAKGCGNHLPTKIEPEIKTPPVRCKKCEKCFPEKDIINHFGLMLCRECIKPQAARVL